ncbi:4,5-DOPA dioxygenase extradiol [Geofilum sp. OHC36d9]|uniref:4,5-DOPA-extradiol-dioxygenase n=1 Tax=Geofilum sp. OHC36d9 TaxID=3458413 RepID=UPI0040339565
MKKITESFSNSSKMPVLFIGHGSPMNAIEENEFVQGFRNVSSQIKMPRAILVVSAHWETAGTKITAMPNPPTIHDFGGFPQALYEVQYPAPGDPNLAAETQQLIKSAEVRLDDNWGLDHGAWSVIRHMYPKANVPVIELSIDYRKNPAEHYALAKELSMLRHKGVLIVGSGNLIHNLQMVDWRRINENFAFDWAQEANTKINEYILNGDHQSLIDFSKQGKAFQLAIPTPEHYLPLLYALALKDAKDDISLFNNQPIGGSLSMTSVKIG